MTTETSSPTPTRIKIALREARFAPVKLGSVRVMYDARRRRYDIDAGGAYHSTASLARAADLIVGLFTEAR